MRSDLYGAQGTVVSGTDDPGKEAQSRRRKRVLVADCDDGARDMLVNLIESLGYETVAAHDANEALEVARLRPLDAALIDIGVPFLEGLPVARRMRELSGQSAMLLIALTGWGQPQYRDMALAAGFDVHLVKPVGVDQLALLLSLH